MTKERFQDRFFTCYSRLSPFWRFQITGWLAFALVSFPLKLEIMGSFLPALFLCFVRDGSSFLMTLGLRSIYLRLSLERISALGVVIVVSCVGGGIIQAGFFLVFHPLLPIQGEIYFTSLMEFNLFYERTGLLLGWSALYFGIRFHASDQARLASVESEYKAAELRLLRAIMNPHFLFNSLNFIKAELLGKHDRLACVVQSFTNYLQFSLVTRNDTFVEVGREFDAIEGYLQVERARFGDEIQIDCRIDPDVRLAKVPGIIIQPLVENSIKHGRRQLGNIPLTVSVLVTRNCGELHLEVRNSGKWQFQSETPGLGGIGLTSLKERLQLLYGSQHSFEIFNDLNQVVVSVRLPLQLHNHAY